MFENVYFAVHAIGFMTIVAVVVFIGLTALGNGFDMVQKRTYKNRKKWDRESS
tara:strand:- start:256 stop:414 length:159 start_codon:yes stop_codon:yes gene_type:complete